MNLDAGDSLTLRCTHRLLRELRIRPQELRPLEASDGLLRDWHASLFFFDRRKCLLFTDTATLFSFVLPGVVRDDLRDIEAIFWPGLGGNLMLSGVDPMAAAIPKPGVPVRLATTNNRSVRGSMNEMIYRVTWRMADCGGVQGADPLELYRMLNECPMSSLDYAYPIEELRIRLAKYSASP
jgi:hypothetical protein